MKACGSRRHLDPHVISRKPSLKSATYLLKIRSVSGIFENRFPSPHMCFNLSIIQGHPHNMLYFKGCHRIKKLYKKSTPFRRQTCGTSTDLLNLRSVSDIFENSGRRWNNQLRSSAVVLYFKGCH